MYLRLQKIILSFLILYGIFGFFILPLLLKSQLETLVTDKLYATIEIDKIYVNPFLFKLRINDVVLKDLQEKELVSFKSLFADFELYSLLRGAIHFDKITLREPKVSLIYDEDKNLNLLHLVKPEEINEKDENSNFVLPRIILDELRVNSGTFIFEDYSGKNPFEFTFKNISFLLEDLDSDEGDAMRAKMRLFANLDNDGSIDFKSKISSITSLKAKGSLDFEASKLFNKWKYFQDILNFEVADGRVSLHTDYIFSLDDINATRFENLSFELNKLRIKPKNKIQDIVNIEKLTLSSTNISPFLRSAEIEDFSIESLRMTLKRNKRGEIDWSRYFKIEGESKNETQSAQPWDMRLHKFSLENSALRFEDSMIMPAVNSQIQAFNFYVLDVTLEGEEPSSYRFDFKLNQKGECKSEGTLQLKNLDFKGNFECKNINVARYDPYIQKSAKEALKRYELEVKQATLNVKSIFSIKKKKSEFDFMFKNTNLALNNLLLLAKKEKKELFGFSQFSLNNLFIDSNKKKIEVEKITLNKPRLHIEKKRDGTLNFLDYVEAKESIKPTNNKSKPYIANIKHFALNNGAIGLKDSSTMKTNTNTIENIYANVYNFSSKEKSYLNYDAQMELKNGGKLKAKGKLSHTPLKQSGEIDLKNISLLLLNPYIQEQLHLNIEDGRVSLNGNLEYEKKEKEADLRFQGSLLLKSLFVDDSLHKTKLLSLGEAKVKSFTFEFSPNRLYIDEMDINSFYVDASIDENGRTNFSKLSKQTKQTTSMSNQTQTEEGLPFRIAKINLNHGSAKFADYSIPLKFFTHIHNLNGFIYSISSVAGDTSYVDIDGDIDRYTSMRINGSIDAGDPRVYTDMSLNFKNIELNSLSGYSATFAGYEIDSGKLNLDLGYEILNGRLIGKNSIHIQKIRLGKRVRDRNVQVLPLRFVIKLLEDPRGFIDINMPVQGDLNNPDFRYGKLVASTMRNLLSSAVTSPFRFLGAVMGIGAAELEYVAFEPGSSQISPPQREKIDKIAELMRMKPNIVLIVSGQYELQKDKEALQMQKLINLVVLKSGIENARNHRSVMSIEMLEKIYEKNHNNDVLKRARARLGELHKEKIAFERAYRKELIALCRDAQAFDEQELISLAQDRAQKIIDYLTHDKMLDASRIVHKGFKHTKKTRESFVKLLLELEVK